MITERMFKNCVDIKKENGVYYPVRFSPKQFEFYRNCSEAVHARSMCSAGIAAEFYAASSVVSLSCKTDCFIRNYCAFDIYENDVFVETSHFDGCPDTVCISYKKREDGVSKITVFFPYSCRVGVCGLTGEVRAQEQPKERHKILAYGDSITQGMSAEHPSFSYATSIARLMGMELLNQGVGGMTFRKGSLDADLSFTPDITIVAYGTNDFTKLNSLDEMAVSAREYLYEMYKINGNSRIYVTSPVYSPIIKQKISDSPDIQEWYAKYTEILNGVCGELNAVFVDGARLIPDMPGFYAEDRHPNDNGFMLYAQNMMKYIAGRT